MSLLRSNLVKMITMDYPHVTYSFSKCTNRPDNILCEKVDKQIFILTIERLLKGICYFSVNHKKLWSSIGCISVMIM
jgi:hypothetical protein